MREFLKGLELDKETIDTIMAEHGKLLQGLKEERDDLKSKFDDLKNSVKNNDDFKTKYEELQTSLKEKEAQQKAEEEEKSMLNRFEALVGEKKFTNDYAKKGLYNDFKEQLANEENKGKGDKEIFEALTKDQVGMFESENKAVDMPPMGEGEENNTKEMPIIW